MDIHMYEDRQRLVDIQHRGLLGDHTFATASLLLRPSIPFFAFFFVKVSVCVPVVSLKETGLECKKTDDLFMLFVCSFLLFTPPPSTFAVFLSCSLSRRDSERESESYMNVCDLPSVCYESSSSPAIGLPV